MVCGLAPQWKYKCVAKLSLFIDRQRLNKSIGMLHVNKHFLR